MPQALEILAVHRGGGLDLDGDLAGAGVRVSPLSEDWSGAGSSGIVFGFGAATEADLVLALAQIARAASAPRGADDPA